MLRFNLCKLGHLYIECGEKTKTVYRKSSTNTWVGQKISTIKMCHICLADIVDENTRKRTSPISMSKSCLFRKSSPDGSEYLPCARSKD